MSSKKRSEQTPSTDAKRRKTSSTDDVESFKSTFSSLSKEIIADLPSDMPQTAREWLEKILEHNIMGGKMNRGLTVIAAYRSLVEERDLSEDEKQKALVLGWCIEFLQAFFLIADDIMDQSTTRRGQPCWYKMPNVGLIAINDAFIVESCVFNILKKYFRKEKYYVDLMDLFHEVTYQTELGQLLDLITAPEDDVNLDRFSIEKYRWIVKYKTAFYSFYLPVACALIMAGIEDKDSHELAKSILLPLGEYFQIQDDYLDCYGDPKVIGKIGTDIKDNKCSWLIVQAIDRASPDQRKVLEENYGRKSDGNEAKVKEVFRELELEKVYQEFEEKSFQELEEKVKKADTSKIPSSVFEKFIKRIYKRKL